MEDTSFIAYKTVEKLRGLNLDKKTVEKLGDLDLDLDFKSTLNQDSEFYQIIKELYKKFSDDFKQLSTKCDENEFNPEKKFDKLADRMLLYFIYYDNIKGKKNTKKVINEIELYINQYGINKFIEIATTIKPETKIKEQKRKKYNDRQVTNEEDEYKGKTKKIYVEYEDEEDESVEKDEKWDDENANKEKWEEIAEEEEEVDFALGDNIEQDPQKRLDISIDKMFSRNFSEDVQQYMKWKVSDNNYSEYPMLNNMEEIGLYKVQRKWIIQIIRTTILLKNCFINFYNDIFQEKVTVIHLDIANLNKNYDLHLKCHIGSNKLELIVQDFKIHTYTYAEKNVLDTNDNRNNDSLKSILEKIKSIEEKINPFINFTNIFEEIN